ncbi:MAG: hypothetical protein Fur0044_14220 [Anaerolineae bacterium]
MGPELAGANEKWRGESNKAIITVGISRWGERGVLKVRGANPPTQKISQP